MHLVAKFFEELTTAELYELLRVRTAVFVVEQKCAYQELDGKDQASLHVYYEQGGQIAAYLRAFRKAPGVVQMGRVLTVEHGKGLGGQLLRAGLEQIREKLRPTCIEIEAQCYAIGFYEREGFRTCSDSFLEDGIPHIKMVLEC